MVVAVIWGWWDVERTTWDWENYKLFFNAARSSSLSTNPNAQKRITAGRTLEAAVVLGARNYTSSTVYRCVCYPLVLILLSFTTKVSRQYATASPRTTSSLRRGYLPYRQAAPQWCGWINVALSLLLYGLTNQWRCQTIKKNASRRARMMWVRWLWHGLRPIEMRWE